MGGFHAGGGASELGGNLTGPGVCDLPAKGLKWGEAGVNPRWPMTGIRFGIYKGSVKQGTLFPTIPVTPIPMQRKLAQQIQCVC